MSTSLMIHEIEEINVKTDFNTPDERDAYYSTNIEMVDAQGAKFCLTLFSKSALFVGEVLKR